MAFPVAMGGLRRGVHLGTQVINSGVRERDVLESRTVDEIAAVSGVAVQLHEGGLDLDMPTDAAKAVGPFSDRTQVSHREVRLSKIDRFECSSFGILSSAPDSASEHPHN